MIIPGHAKEPPAVTIGKARENMLVGVMFAVASAIEPLPGGLKPLLLRVDDRTFRICPRKVGGK